MLHTTSSKRQVLLYFQNPKSAYERFINKLWVERKNIFEEKRTFIIRANSRWKNMNEEDRTKFMARAAPASSTKKKQNNVIF